MIKNICAVDLDLPEVPLDIMPTIPITNFVGWNAKLIPKNLLNAGFINFLKTHDIEVIDNIALFATPPGGKSYLHLDSINKQHNLSYINYVYGESTNHEMVWYNIDYQPDRIGNESSLTYSDKDEALAEKMYRHVVKFPSLVKIGVPHQIFNYDTKIRYCLSISVVNNSHTIDHNYWSQVGGIDFDWGVNALQNYIIK
jgi:hypothetical protein